MFNKLAYPFVLLSNVQAGYVTSVALSEKLDLLEALGVRSTVQETPGYCASLLDAYDMITHEKVAYNINRNRRTMKLDSPFNDKAFQIRKNTQISALSSSIFVGEDKKPREIPAEFSIIAVVKLKRKRKNSRLLTIVDNFGRQQFALNVGGFFGGSSVEKKFSRESKNAGPRHSIKIETTDSDKLPYGVWNLPHAYLLNLQKLDVDSFNTVELKNKKNHGNYDMEWHKIAWTVAKTGDDGKYKSEIWVDCEKISEETFERSTHQEKIPGALSRVVLGRETATADTHDAFIGDIQQLDLYDDPSFASKMCNNYFHTRVLRTGYFTPNCTMNLDQME